MTSQLASQLQENKINSARAQATATKMKESAMARGATRMTSKLGGGSRQQKQKLMNSNPSVLKSFTRMGTMMKGLSARGLV